MESKDYFRRVNAFYRQLDPNTPPTPYRENHHNNNLPNHIDDSQFVMQCIPQGSPYSSLELSRISAAQYYRHLIARRVNRDHVTMQTGG